MKLDCELTQELYAQYHDGDLSQGVRKRVDEHLADCQECREAYSSGENFKVSTAPVPPSLDEKVALRLRVTKLKFISGLLVGLLLLVVYVNYNIGRSHLARDIRALEGSFKRLSMGLFWNRSEVDREFRHVNRTLEILERNLNLVEKRQLDKWSPVRLSDLPRFISLLEQRRAADYFGQRDQEIQDYVEGKFRSLGGLMGSEADRFWDSGFGILSSPFLFLDTATLAKTLHEINEAVSGFYWYSALPGELEPLTDQELVQIIEQSLPWEGIRVSMYNDASFYNFTVEWENGEFEIRGIIDTYTGEIGLLVFGESQVQGDGIREKEESVEDLTQLLAALYGPEYTFDIQQTKLNDASWNQHSTRIPRSTREFIWTAKYQGHGVDIGWNRNAVYDAETSRLSYITGIWVPNDPINTTLNYTPEEGFEILNLADGYRYQESTIIRSFITNQWVLAHKYQQTRGGTRYLNAVTGKEDFPAQKPTNYLYN